MELSAGSRTAGRRGATSASWSAARAGSTSRARHAALARPHDAAAPARPRGAARAALPRPQDPRRRAVPLLVEDMDPVADLTDAQSSETAAAAGRRRPRATGLKLDRPPRPDFGDYSTNAAMLLAPVARRAAARRSPSGSARSSASGSASRSSGWRSPGPGFLNLFMADRWFLDALAALLEAGERLRRAAAAARAPERRVRERQPHRPDHGRLGAPRRLRRLALADPRAAPATGRARVLRERRRQPGAAASASRSGRARAARSRPRTATAATTCASWPSGSTARPTPTRTSSRGAASS